MVFVDLDVESSRVVEDEDEDDPLVPHRSASPADMDSDLAFAVAVGKRAGAAVVAHARVRLGRL